MWPAYMKEWETLLILKLVACVFNWEFHCIHICCMCISLLIVLIYNHSVHWSFTWMNGNNIFTKENLRLDTSFWIGIWTLGLPMSPYNIPKISKLRLKSLFMVNKFFPEWLNIFLDVKVTKTSPHKVELKFFIPNKFLYDIILW